MTAVSGIPGVLPLRGSPPQPSQQAVPAGQEPGPSSRVRRYLPHVTVHNVWMVVLLVIMVGKAGEWVPLVSGLPVLKIAFLIAALYVNRVSIAFAPVRVGSLMIARLAIAFLILSIVSIVFSIYKSNTLIASYLSLIYLVSFVMLVKTTQTWKDVERLLIGLAVAGSSLSIATLIDYHGGQAHINRNFDPNDLAYSLDTILPVVLALRGRGWGLRRFLVTVLVLVMCMAVLLTASRGGALGLVVVMLAASAFPLDLAKDGELKRPGVARLLVKLSLVALLGSLLFGFLPEKSKEHLLTLIHPEEDYNASTTLDSSRRVLWTRDLRLALERPIGYGMASATRVDGIYGHGHWRTVHNSVIQAFLELGLLGLVLYLASYYVAWRELGRRSAARPRDGPDSRGAMVALYARALRISLLGNFAAGFFLSQAYSACLWMTLAICCAFIRIVAANNSTATSQRPAASPGWRRPR
jgi:O-antigen ligase